MYNVIGIEMKSLLAKSGLGFLVYRMVDNKNITGMSYISQQNSGGEKIFNNFLLNPTSFSKMSTAYNYCIPRKRYLGLIP